MPTRFCLQLTSPAASSAASRTRGGTPAGTTCGSGGTTAATTRSSGAMQSPIHASCPPALSEFREAEGWCVFVCVCVHVCVYVCVRVCFCVAPFPSMPCVCRPPRASRPPAPTWRDWGPPRATLGVHWEYVRGMLGQRLGSCAHMHWGCALRAPQRQEHRTGPCTLSPPGTTPLHTGLSRCSSASWRTWRGGGCPLTTTRTSGGACVCTCVCACICCVCVCVCACVDVCVHWHVRAYCVPARTQGAGA